MEKLLRTYMTRIYYSNVGNCCGFDDRSKYLDYFSCKDNEGRNDGKATA